METNQLAPASRLNRRAAPLREPMRDNTVVTGAVRRGGETKPDARNPALLNFMGRRRRRVDGAVYFQAFCGSYFPPHPPSPSAVGNRLCGQESVNGW